MTKRKTVAEEEPNITADSVYTDPEIEAGHLGDVDAEPLPFDDALSTMTQDIADRIAAKVQDDYDSGRTKPLVHQPGDSAVVVDDESVRVTISLPRGALIALLEQDHPMADIPHAVWWGLMRYGLPNTYDLTPIGEKVLAGFDQTAVRHKMNAAWRIAANAKTDNGV